MKYFLNGPEDILTVVLEVWTHVSNVQAQRFQVLLLDYQRVESVVLACFELALVDDSPLSLILFYRLDHFDGKQLVGHRPTCLEVEKEHGDNEMRAEGQTVGLTASLPFLASVMIRVNLGWWYGRADCIPSKLAHHPSLCK